MRKWLLLLLVAGCVSRPEEGTLERAIHDQRKDLWWNCLMKNLRQPEFGPEINQHVDAACKAWARSRVRRL